MSYKNFSWEFWIAAVAAAFNVVIAVSAETWFYVVFFWQVSAVGLFAVVIGIWRKRFWWLLLFAPAFVIPLWFGAMLIYACGQGDCL